MTPRIDLTVIDVAPATASASSTSCGALSVSLEILALTKFLGIKWSLRFYASVIFILLASGRGSESADEECSEQSLRISPRLRNHTPGILTSRLRPSLMMTRLRTTARGSPRKRYPESSVVVSRRRQVERASARCRGLPWGAFLVRKVFAN